MKIQHSIVFLVAVFYGAGLSAMDVEGASFEACAHILNAVDSTEAQKIDAVNRVRIIAIAESSVTVADACISLLQHVYNSFNDAGRRAVFEALSMIAVRHGLCAAICSDFIIGELPELNEPNFPPVVAALAAIGRAHLFCKEQVKESIRDFLNARYGDGLPEYGRVELRGIDEAHRMRRELSVSHVSHGEGYGFALCIHGWAAAGHLYPV
jgi:hypothetical protein